MSKGPRPKSKSSAQNEETAIVEAVRPEVVAAYLRDNPDFFSEHLDLLAQLPPSPMIRADGVIDLRAVTVERLKTDANRMSDQFEDMLETGRANQTLLNRTHASVLHILEARDFENFIQAVTNDLATVIDVDCAVLIVESDLSDRPVFTHPGLRMVDSGFVAPIISEHAVRLEGSINGDAR
ncbi:MAG: DUF484 family protein, partial [Pseudomonadota bacterium]